MPNRKRAKIACLVLLFAAVFIISTTDNGSIETAHGFSSGPPAGFTGAPGEATCTQCHGGFPVNGQFAITAPANYIPGQTYQITVTHTNFDESRMKWGFQLTALDGSNTRAGNLQQTSTTIVLDNAGPGGNRQYIEHNSKGTFEGATGGAAWTFDWTAPVSDAGPVTLYAAGNQADGDFTSSNDEIYTTSAVINPAPACAYSISPNNAFFTASGGNAGVDIATQPGCSWSVSITRGWITVLSSSSGSGSATVDFSVSPNSTGSPRLGALSVAGQTLTVIQDGGLGDNCSYVIAPTSRSISTAGGTGSIEVKAEARCAWQAVPNNNWVTITSSASGIGSAAITYSVAANAGARRTGTITIAGRTFFVKQKGF